MKGRSRSSLFLGRRQLTLQLPRVEDRLRRLQRSCELQGDVEHSRRNVAAAVQATRKDDHWGTEAAAATLVDLPSIRWSASGPQGVLGSVDRDCPLWRTLLQSPF